MSARAYAFMTGLFIVVLASAIGAAFYWFGGSHAESASYTVVANRSIMGLHGQSTVYYRGVPVGNVTSIQLVANNAQKTYIGISIDASIPVTASTYATLHSQGVTGLATINLNDTGESAQRLPTAQNQQVMIPLRGGTSSLTAAGQALAAKLTAIADSLQQILSEKNRQRIDTILANTAQLTAQLSDLEKKLAAGLGGLPALSQDARDTLHHVDNLVAHMTKLTDSLHELSGEMKDFAHVGQVAGRELAHQTLPKLGATMDELQQTARALQDLSRSLENNPQQLLFGPTERRAGPGEPGFEGDTP
ncbi:MAG TPA: MlaD family protein [Gammaproteobacteria bacterium]|nr:MlaD family protein [Gammaproteobacteria bacterium]